MKNVLIIGGGSIGQAISTSLIPAIETKIFDRDPLKSTVSTVDDGLKWAELVFICVPSGAFREMVDVIVQSKTGAPIIVLTKGLDKDTGKFPYEILVEAGVSKWALLYGPMIAEHLVDKKNSFAILASSDQSFAGDVKSVFDNHLRIEYGADFHTIAILGVLKNIYAFGTGIIYGLDLGANIFGMYTVRVMQEMRNIVMQMKGDIKQVEYISGLGDFIATSTSDASKNRITGTNFMKGGELPTTSEGINSLKMFCEKLQVCPPILLALKAVVDKKDTAPLLRAIISYE